MDLRVLAKGRVGSILGGKWRLERLIGLGGCAAVYEARHNIGHRSAIKILHPDLAEDDSVRRRFEEEARASNRFRHPGAVAVRDMDLSETGAPYLVMELLEGESLKQRAERVGSVPADDVLRFVDAVLDVLADAHDAGVVHRDIKPDNIFLCSDGQVKLLDFGIARILGHAHRTALSRQGSVLGTVSYMPPEQVRGADIDGRADIFAVGAVMFRLLTHQRIHTANGEVELLVKMATEPAPPVGSVAPEVDPAIAAIVDRALQFDRRSRYPDVRTMQQDVRAVRRGDEPPFARSPIPGHPEAEPRQPPRRRPSERPPASARDRRRLVGKTIGGRYALTHLIGEGGMGAVYEARTPEGERVAVKVIGQEWALRSRDAHQRFQREARAVEHIDNPHVVKVLDADTDEAEGVPYIVMELLGGLDVERLLSMTGRMAPGPAVRLFLQACSGLGAAHAHDIVHRDIKPANLLLKVDAESRVTVKICDFGIAKSVRDDAASALTKTGGMVGTLLYASPEHAKNAKRVDPRADIWSLCMSLHQALSGQRPWAHCEAEGELVLAICTEEVPKLRDLVPDIDPRLAAVVHRGLERKVEDRWQSIDELARALAEFADDDGPLTLDSLIAAGLGAAAGGSDARTGSAERAPARSGAEAGEAATRLSAPGVLGGIAAAPPPTASRIGPRLLVAVFGALLVLGGVASLWRFAGSSSHGDSGSKQSATPSTTQSTPAASSGPTLSPSVGASPSTTSSASIAKTGILPTARVPTAPPRTASGAAAQPKAPPTAQPTQPPPPTPPTPSRNPIHL